MAGIGGMLGRIGGWFRSLPPVGLAFLGLVVLSLFVAGSVTAYRTYDYIEHDNDFCMSCHLMAEPYELFGQSAHRDLGCKACHHPSFAGRSQMALTQIIEQPDSLAAHAEVPNEKCASCHIDGNPEEWVLIANSAGHRVHLESDDPELQGLQCVQCHSSSLHEFAATDQTCAQSGCHEDVEIRLGRMGDFTIHCAACHGFNRVLPEQAGLAEARAAVAPTGDECLSCHAMRTLVEMPPDEPHDQVCSACHNPHEQETPAQAVETCASVGCHNDVQDLSSFHRGLDHLVVEDCTTCHQAHEFRVDGDDCLSCHQDIYDDPGVGGSVAHADPVDRDSDGLHLSPPAGPVGIGDPIPSPEAGEVPAGHAALPTDTRAETHPSPPAAPFFVGLGAPIASTTPVTQEVPFLTGGEVVFRHSNHRDVGCTDCHDSSDRHGALTLTSLVDCRSCHHVAPAAQDCRTCHGESVLGPEALVARGWPMTFSTGESVLRDIPFLHEDHESTDCGECHQDGIDRAPQVANCNNCHQEHHQAPAEVDCMTCHQEPPPDAHTVESHLGCTGSGCHLDPPLARTPRNRSACLACHQDMTDHRPDGECVECHALPAPRGGIE